MGCLDGEAEGFSSMIRFLRFRPARERGSASGALFLFFGAITLTLAGPKIAAGYKIAAPPAPKLRPVVGPVRHVVDGDTFWIGDQKIRLWGIDAPEAATPSGPTATRYLRQVVGRHRLKCRQAGAPSYDRLVARCVDPWGRDIAEIMVGAGWALDWPKFSKGYYRAAQARAVAVRAGAHGYDAPLWR